MFFFGQGILSQKQENEIKTDFIYTEITQCHGFSKEPSVASPDILLISAEGLTGRLTSVVVPRYLAGSGSALNHICNAGRKRFPSLCSAFTVGETGADQSRNVCL